MYKRGFTILELMVSVAIFGLMTTLTLAKYGTFNQGVLLNNAAYDLAITARTVQSNSLHTKSLNRTTNEFGNPYGIHFDKSADYFITFVDINGDNIYNADNPAEFISKSNIKASAKTLVLCVNSCVGTTIIYYGTSGSPGNGCVVTSTPGVYSCDPTLKSIDIVYGKIDASATITTTFNSDGGLMTSNDALIYIYTPDQSKKLIYFNTAGYIGVK